MRRRDLLVFGGILVNPEILFLLLVMQSVLLVFPQSCLWLARGLRQLVPRDHHDMIVL
jgi:hypothetical protein